MAEQENQNTAIPSMQVSEQLQKILRTAVKYGASDVYLSTGSKPVLRIHGEMVSIDNHGILTVDLMKVHLQGVLKEAAQKQFDEYWDADLALEIETIGRFRVNVFTQRKGIAMVLRLIPENVQTIDELALPKQLKKVAQMQKGLVICTGPTGSGKSTTLAAMVHEINRTQNKHIITIEDPIEFVHQNQLSLVNQREVGSHVQDFARGLRAALREAPDVILLGEMRDLETISLAITAAETGHLVFGTLHTSGAAKSIDRIIDAFPSSQQNQIRSQISESLAAVVWQNLIKSTDGNSRVAALEILFHNSAVANMIRKGNIHQIGSAIETGLNEGMQTMKKAVTDLIMAGKISEEEGVKYLPDDL
jgi:twitching motility protein PilT